MWLTSYDIQGAAVAYVRTVKTSSGATMPVRRHQAKRHLLRLHMDHLLRLHMDVDEMARSTTQRRCVLVASTVLRGYRLRHERPTRRPVSLHGRTDSRKEITSVATASGATIGAKCPIPGISRTRPSTTCWAT